MVEWRTTTLEECTDILGDGLHGTPKYTENGEYAFVNGNNLVDGEILIKKETKRVDYSQYEKYKKPLTNRTILVSINGTLGNVGVYGSEKIILGKSACYFNVKESVDKDFIYYIVSSPTFKQYLESNATGTTIKNISLKQMREYTFELPEIGEQKRISSVLRKIDEKIKNNRAINKNLEQQARSLFKAWFVDFDPFANTMLSDWKKGKLKDILKLKRQSIKTGENTTLPYLPIDVIPMRTFALTDFKPNAEAQSSLITFDKDDIIIGAMRVYFHRVVLAPCDGITRTTCFTLAPYNNEYFSFALLCCDQESSIDYAQSTSKGSTMPYAIWEGGLGDMEIIIPTPEIAKKFNEIVLPMLRQIQNSYFENNRLREIRNALLPRLMSDEVDVSNLDL